MAAIMLVFLATSSVASRVKHAANENADDPMQWNATPAVPLHPGVHFLDYLISKQNPKNALCENVRVPKGKKTKGKRNRDETEARECGADGFLMSMNVEHSMKLYFQRSLGSMAGSLAAKAAKVAGAVRGIPSGWQQFIVSEELLKSPGSEELMRQQFEARFLQLQGHSRSSVLSDRDSKLCVFEETSRIPVELFQWRRGSKAAVKRDPTKVSSDEYVHELLSDSDYFYIHEDKPIIAFIKIVNNKADAEHVGLPWVEGWSPYAYSPLVCSAVKGGGTIAMQKILEFAVGQQVGRILISALTHVAWLYYGKAGATFIDRRGKDIDVSHFAEMNPRPNPISEKEAVERRELAPPPAPAEAAEPAAAAEAALAEEAKEQVAAEASPTVGAVEPSVAAGAAPGADAKEAAPAVEAAEPSAALDEDMEPAADEDMEPADEDMEPADEDEDMEPAAALVASAEAAQAA